MLLWMALWLASAGQVQRVELPAPRAADEGMPAGGMYFRAMTYDEQARHQEASRFFELAAAELARRDRPVPPAEDDRLRQRAEKARWEAEVSGVLAGRGYRSTPSYISSLGGRPIDEASARRSRTARAQHQKWLAARAFLGRPQPALFKKAHEHYATALLEKSEASDRLGLAALLAETGDRAAAARQAPRPDAPEWVDPQRALDVACYRAAMGEADLAVAALSRVPGRVRVEQLSSAEWDPIRATPRFRAFEKARRAER
jgi:hypothetical protein